MLFDYIIEISSSVLTAISAAIGVSVLIKYLQKDENLNQKMINQDINIFNEKDKNEIIKKLKQNILENTKNNILEDIQKDVKKHLIENNKTEIIKNQFDKTIFRLKDELFSLSKRGNLNLSIGIITTLTGLVLLGTFILQGNMDLKNSEHFFINFVPRISLVILIEIFAYFFLKLYKNNIAEIKYFQNEITTIETKLLALQIAVELKDNSIIKESINNLLQSERNFILNKGQTTVDIEKNKIELQSTNSILDKITSIINKNS